MFKHILLLCFVSVAYCVEPLDKVSPCQICQQLWTVAQQAVATGKKIEPELVYACNALGAAAIVCDGIVPLLITALNDLGAHISPYKICHSYLHICRDKRLDTNSL